MTKTKVLVTGASGQVGYLVYSRLLSKPDQFDVYGVDRKQEASGRVPGSWDLNLPPDKFSVIDLSDFDAVAEAVSDMDVVAHLGADPEGREWDSVLNNNIVGTYNVFEASRQAGVKRVVGASSIMVSEGHREREPSPRNGLFLDRQREKPIASAHQVHETAFSSTGRGKRPSQAHAKSHDCLFLDRQGEKGIASARQVS